MRIVSKYVLNGVILWALFATLSSSLSHFILRILLGNNLGAEGLGIYTLAFTFFLFGLSFSGFGTGAALTKNIAENIANKEIIKDYIVSGFILSLITGSLMCLILFILSPYIANNIFDVNELEIYLKLVAICFPFIAIQKCVLAILNGLRKIKSFAIINIFQNISVVLLSILFVFVYNEQVFGAIIGLIIPTIIISVISVFLIKDLLRDITKINYSVFKQVVSFGYFVMIAGSISFINTQVDSLLIGYYLNAFELGIYSIALLFAQITILIPSSMQVITTPSISNMFGNQDYNLIKYYIKRNVKITIFLCIILFISISIGGYFIIDLLFDDTFQDAFVPMIILCIGFVVYAPWVSVGSLLSCINKVNIIYKINLFFMIINILLNVLLIPYYGIVGAAISTSIVHIFSSIISISLSFHYLNKLVR